MSTPVKWFASTDTGAPVLNGVAGSLIAVLKACLVDGYNAQTPTSINVAGGVATVVFPTPHGFADGRTVRISGANEADFNKDWKVTILTDKTLTFQVGAGAFPALATGSISIQVAPLDWLLQFNDAGNNAATFQSKDPSSTKYSLTVDDGAATKTGTAVANVTADRGLLTRCARLIMSEKAYSTTTADRSTGLVLRKAQNTTATARPWYVIGDGKRFFIGVNWSESYAGSFDFSFFGDIISYKPGDAHHCCLSAARGISVPDNGSPSHATTAATTTPPYARYTTSAHYVEYDTFLDVGLSFDVSMSNGWFGKTFGTILGRAYNQAGGFSQAMPCYGHGGGMQSSVNNAASWSANGLPEVFRGMAKPGCSQVPYPNPTDNSVMFQFPVYIREEAFGGAVRGHLPGMIVPIQNINPVPAVFNNVRVNGTEFKDVLVIPSGKYHPDSGQWSRLAFDITGPWE